MVVKGVISVETAKIFENGRSQAVRLPKEFRFSGDEVFVQRLGRAVMLYPKDAAWETFISGLNGFSEDFLADGREAEIPAERDSL